MQSSPHNPNPNAAAQKVGRRKFMASTLAGTVAASTLMSRAAAQSADSPLKMGLIGCGWYGMVDVMAAFKVGGVQFTAICDVDSQHLEDSAKKIAEEQGERPQTFKDYREMLAHPDLQAVIIATPPQWHALPFLAALDRGLDIYMEKPLAYDVREGQAMAAAAEKSDRIVQVGFQRRQSQAFQQVKDYIEAGNIGKVVCVDAQIHYTAGMNDPTPQDPPASLDWDFWCGPAPKLPYSPQIGHMSWRLEKEYGNGHLVDWGIHLIDATRYILNETMPQAVQAAGGIYHLADHITTPDVLTAHFDFKTCPVTWRHRLWGAQEYTPEVSNGIFFYGEEATVFASDNKWVVIPKGRDSERQENTVRTDTGTVHMQKFLECVATREKPTVTVQDGYQSTAAVQLAMIAYETERKIAWDAAAQEIPDDAQANALLKRAYRGPWEHPYA